MSWNLLGHEWAETLLKEQIAHATLRHAYLLSGAEGVGRRALALRLAQAINCLQPTAPGEPCRLCRTCRQIEAMQHPDLSVVQAEEGGSTLKVDQVRELLYSLALRPYDARYRVALLLRFEQAHNAAANALLKTLEEPPSNVVIILTADSPESLLPTIVSRCSVLRLRPAPLEALKTWLEREHGLPIEQARALAHISGGRAGQALRLHRSPEKYAEYTSRLQELQKLLQAGQVQRFAYAKSISEKRPVVRELLQVWLSFWRDVLLTSLGSRAPLVNLDYAPAIQALAAALPPETIQHTLAAHQRTLDILERNANLRLALEVLMLDLPHA
jgi:DNA polymerase-3 subunit delta'